MIGNSNGTPPWLYVNNPKTGSQCISQALYQVRGTEQVGIHHSFLMDGRQHREYKAKLTSVRNPWDRMVSAWAFHTGRRGKRPVEKGQTFEEWLIDPKPWQLCGVDMKRTPQVAWAHQTKFQIRFEYMQSSFEEACRVFGIDAPALVTQNESCHDYYRDYYSTKLRDIVADRFAPDIAEWGYRF